MGAAAEHRGNALIARQASEEVDAMAAQAELSRIATVVAELRDPNPSFRGVNYDGLGPRYTTDPAPVAEAITV